MNLKYFKISTFISTTLSQRLKTHERSGVPLQNYGFYQEQMYSYGLNLFLIVLILVVQPHQAWLMPVEN